MIISDKATVADKLNNLFIETVENLNIERFSSESNEDINHKNIVKILKIYESHPCFIKIKENISVENKFAFDLMAPEFFKKQLLHFKLNKASGKSDMPVITLAVISDIVSYYLSNICDDRIWSNNFPHSLKLADITPIHKKEDKTLMRNCRPIILLPVISKIFEKNT